MFEQVTHYMHFSPHQKALLQAFIVLVVFVAIFLLSIVYYSWKKRRSEFKHFAYLLKDRDLSTKEMKKLFSYLKRHHIELHLLLESEHVMTQAVEACGLDKEKMKEKLGFNTSSLIKHYMERQQRLRKQWNRS